MTEFELRTCIVEIAKSWLKTPFVDSACLKGHGVDCAYLLTSVVTEAGIYGKIELPRYSPQVYLHKKKDGTWDDTYEKIIRQYAREITETEVKPGDMVLYRVAHSYTHGGIIERWPESIIHPIRPHGVICSDAREGFVQRRAHKFFSVFPLRSNEYLSIPFIPNPETAL